MKNPLMRLLLVLAVLAAASLACNLPGSSSGGVNPPANVTPINTQQVQQLEQQLQATLVNSNASGQVSVTLTQDQLTGIVASELAKQPDKILTDPRVVLTNGQMQVFGKVSQSGIALNSEVVMKPNVDANGNVSMEIVSIKLGPFPVPDALKQQFSSLANNALSDYLATSSNQFKVNSVNITEGQMTITGVRQ